MKSEILTPGQLEQIETAMHNGTATQEDGVRLCNAYRVVHARLEGFTDAIVGIQEAIAINTVATEHNTRAIEERDRPEWRP